MLNFFSILDPPSISSFMVVWKLAIIYILEGTVYSTVQMVEWLSFTFTEHTGSRHYVRLVWQ